MDFPFLESILSVLIAVILFIVIRHTDKNQKIKLNHIFGILLFTLTICIIFSVTGISPISGFHWEISKDSFSVKPLIGIFSSVKSATAIGEPMVAVLNIVGNILLSVPFGFLLPFFWEKFRKLWKTVCFGAMISLIIECTQLFLTRWSDIDDILLNTTGTLIGYALFSVSNRIFAKNVVKKREPENVAGWNAMPYIIVGVAYLTTIILGFFERAAIMLR